MDAKTLRNSTLEWLERAYRLLEITREWLKLPQYSEYWSLYTIEDEMTIVKYVREVLLQGCLTCK